MQPAYPDPVKAMMANRARLVSRKRQLEEDHKRAVAEIDDEIRNIDMAMATVKKAIEPYLCPDCGGSGTRRVPDAAGQSEDRPCPSCKGTGIASVR